MAYISDATMTVLLKADPATLSAIAECNERMARLCAVMEQAEQGRAFTGGQPNRISLAAADYTRLREQRDRAVELLRRIERDVREGDINAGVCVLCGEYLRNHPHDEDCELAALLSEVV